MIIPINLHPERSSSSTSTCTFPPAFAQFGSDELVLIELQGSLEVDGDNLGQMVGKLNVETSTVSNEVRNHIVVESLTDMAITEEIDAPDRTSFTRGETCQFTQTPRCVTSFITSRRCERYWDRSGFC